MDTSFCSWIPLSHLFWRPVKTASKVFRCQKLSTSIICMIQEMTTGSFLCRLDSKGVKPIPAIIMLLYLSNTFCPSIICCIWCCIECFECVALAYRKFCTCPSFFQAHSSYSLRYCHYMSASPLSMLSAICFHHHHLLGLVPLSLYY